MVITNQSLRRVGLCVCLPTFGLLTDRTFVFRMRAEVRPYAILLRAIGSRTHLRFNPLP